MERKAEKLSERRRQHRAYFDVPQIRQIFMIPEPLMGVMERGCDRYGITKSEFLRRLLFAYALDVRNNGAVSRFLDEFFTPDETIDIAPIAELLRGYVSDKPELQASAESMIAQGQITVPHQQRMTVQDYLVNHADELLAAFDQPREPERSAMANT